MYSEGPFVNKDCTLKEIIRYLVGTLTGRIFCAKSLVLETVYYEILNGEIRFDKYLAVPILEIIDRTGNFSTLPSLGSF